MGSRFQVTKEVEFDYGHRIQDHGSKCKNLHGHRGKLQATFSGPLQTSGSSTGMVIDFGDIKAWLMELHDLWDHGLILEKSDELLIAINAWMFPDTRNVGLGKLIIMENAPTAENLAYFAFCYLTKKVIAETDTNDLHLDSVMFYETPTSSATIDVRYLDNVRTRP